MSCNRWELKSLGDIGKIVTGKTPSTKNKDNFGIDYLFITPKDMGEGKKINITERRLSEQGVNTVKKQFISGPAICVSCIGSDMGKVAVCEKYFVTNQHLTL